MSRQQTYKESNSYVGWMSDEWEVRSYTIIPSLSNFRGVSTTVDQIIGQLQKC